MRGALISRASRVVFGLVIFATLATAILLRTPKWLSDFDQSFYITVAYDLAHHGVFSNGVFDTSTARGRRRRRDASLRRYIPPLSPPS